MSTQKDFQPGLDLSSLTTATLAQIIQSIANIAPLANIGGVVFQAGTSQAATIAQGTNGSPSITDNPRFARYVWINTFAMPAVLYLYNSTSGNWVSTTIAAASVGPTQLAAHVSALDHFFTATAADATKANKILVMDSAGDEVTLALLATLLVANSVPLTAIDKTGATDLQVLQYKTSDGLVAFRSLTAAIFAANSIGLEKLAAGTLGHLLQMGATAWESVAAKTALSGKGLYLDSLGDNSAAGGAPSTGQVIQFDGSNPLWSTLPLITASGAKTTAGTLAAAGGLETIAHDLASKPTLFKVYLLCTTIDAGYAVNDELAWESLYSTGGSAGGGVYADATNVYIRHINDTIAIPHKTTGTGTALTRASWKARIYAWI
jgi:hypothetical protein